MVRKAKKVQLPMATWHQLARHLQPDAFCTVLRALNADSRTWSAAAAHALAKWSEVEAKNRKKFGGTWVPQQGAWGQLAYAIACARIPLRSAVVADIRWMLIKTGSVAELIRLGASYSDPPTGRELEELAEAVYAGHRYDWARWSELVQFVDHLYPRELARYVVGKQQAAISDNECAV